MVTRRNFFGGALAAGAVGLPGAGCASTGAAILGAAVALGYGVGQRIGKEIACK